MGITQLAIEYCNVLIEDTSRREALFPGFDFDASVSVAFAAQDSLVMPLVDRASGSAATSPDTQLTRDELDALISRLAASGGDAERTQTIAKAACAAVLGSATILIQ